jgi:hypothetical protein
MRGLVAFFDDFYPDPDDVRAIALSGRYNPPHAAFTGTEFRCPGFPMRLVVERVAELTRLSLHYDRRRPAVFRALTEEEGRRKTKHVHVDKTGLSCLICLSESGGTDPHTSFYRHRETGLLGLHDRAALLRAAQRARTLPGPLRRRLDREGGDVRLWERVGEIPYRFNRLLVFDARLFHLAGSGVGATLESAKLTQNFSCRPARWHRPDLRIAFGPAVRPLGPSHP